MLLRYLFNEKQMYEKHKSVANQVQYSRGKDPYKKYYC